MRHRILYGVSDLEAVEGVVQRHMKGQAHRPFFPDRREIFQRLYQGEELLQTPLHLPSFLQQL